MNRTPVMNDADKAKYGDAPTTDVNAGAPAKETKAPAVAKPRKPAAKKKPAVKKLAATIRQSPSNF